MTQPSVPMNQLGIPLLDSQDSQLISVSQNARVTDAENPQKCCSAYKPYMKIAAQAIFAAVAISTIWSFLSNVDTLTVFPTKHRLDHGAGALFSTYDGLFCYNRYTASEFVKECNAVAQSMINQTAEHPEWECSSRVDDKTSLIWDFPLVTVLWIEMIAFAVLYAFFSMVHDCSLVHYQRNNRLDALQFWPTRPLWDHFPMSSCVFRVSLLIFAGFVKCLATFFDSTMKCFCTCLIWIPMLILYVAFVMAAMIVFLVAFLLELIFGNLLYLPLCHCATGLISTSAVWVGLSRTLVVIWAHLFTLSAYSGFNLPSEQYIDGHCECYCQYALDFRDFAGFLLVAYIITFRNLSFLNSWNREAKHRQHHFYLLSFFVPMWFASAVNPDDTTESVIRDPEQYHHRIQMAIPLRIEEESKEVINIELDQGKGTASVVTNDSENGSLESAICCRLCLSGISITISFLIVAVGLLSWAFSDLLVIWKWPSWIKYVIYTLSAFVFIAYIFMFGIVRRKIGETGYFTKWIDSQSSEIKDIFDRIGIHD